MSDDLLTFDQARRMFDEVKSLIDVTFSEREKFAMVVRALVTLEGLLDPQSFELELVTNTLDTIGR